MWIMILISEARSLYSLSPAFSEKLNKSGGYLFINMKTYNHFSISNFDIKIIKLWACSHESECA